MPLRIGYVEALGVSRCEGLDTARLGKGGGLFFLNSVHTYSIVSDITCHLHEAGIDAAGATGYDPLLDTEPELARTVAASVKPRIAFGERAGEKVRRIGSGFGYTGEQPDLTGPRCASVNGFSLHANTAIPAHRRDQLERLIRSTGRGAVSLERLEQDANGDRIDRCTRPWSDGTTGMKLAPLELVEKLAAIVPLPRAHLVRYGGC